MTRTFERFPPRYQAWALEAGRPLAPAEYSPDCPDDGPAQGADDGPVAIRYPLDGTRFVLDPDRAEALQVLAVAVVAPAGTGDVKLLVDGAEVDRARSPYTLRWRLAPGDHELVARAGTVESPRVAIHVRR